MDDLILPEQRKAAYPEYAQQLSEVPDEPNLLEHLGMLNVLSREAGSRVQHRDGELFRKAVFDLVDEIGDLVSSMSECYEVGSAGGFRSACDLMSGKLAELSELAEEGISDLQETARFFKMTEAVCKRVEKMEELKTGRMSVMSEKVVLKLVDKVGDVLQKHLPTERARAAYAEIVEGVSALEVEG